MRGYATFALPGREGGWLLGFEAFPDLLVMGATPAEARTKALPAVISHVGSLIDQGVPVPAPLDMRSVPGLLLVPSIVAIRIANHNQMLRRPA